jgi:hypothetical protein
MTDIFQPKRGPAATPSTPTIGRTREPSLMSIKLNSPQRPNISSTPRMNQRDAMLPGLAMQNVGGKLYQAGSTLRQQQDELAVYSAYNAYRMDILEADTEQMSRMGADARGVKKDMQSYIDEAMTRHMDGLGNADQQMLFKIKADDFNLTTVRRAAIREAQETERWKNETARSDIAVQMAVIAKNPSEDAVIKAIKHHEQLLDSLYGNRETTAQKANARKTFFGQLASVMITNAPDRALAFIEKNSAHLGQAYPQFLEAAKNGYEKWEGDQWYEALLPAPNEEEYEKLKKAFRGPGGKTFDELPTSTKKILDSIPGSIRRREQQAEEIKDRRMFANEMDLVDAMWNAKGDTKALDHVLLTLQKQRPGEDIHPSFAIKMREAIGRDFQTQANNQVMGQLLVRIRAGEFDEKPYELLDHLDGPGGVSISQLGPLYREVTKRISDNKKLLTDEQGKVHKFATDEALDQLKDAYEGGAFGDKDTMEAQNAFYETTAMFFETSRGMKDRESVMAEAKRLITGQRTRNYEGGILERRRGWELDAMRRGKIKIDDVQDLPTAQADIINKYLIRVLGVPSPTDDQIIRMWRVTSARELAMIARRDDVQGIVRGKVSDAFSPVMSTAKDDAASRLGLQKRSGLRRSPTTGIILEHPDAEGEE